MKKENVFINLEKCSKSQVDWIFEVLKLQNIDEFPYINLNKKIKYLSYWNTKVHVGWLGYYDDDKPTLLSDNFITKEIDFEEITNLFHDWGYITDTQPKPKFNKYKFIKRQLIFSLSCYLIASFIHLDLTCPLMILEMEPCDRGLSLFAYVGLSLIYHVLISSHSNEI